MFLELWLLKISYKHFDLLSTFNIFNIDFWTIIIIIIII
jgi:hypothetical protein